MKIAVVGGGLTGLAAARLLGEDPRHVTTVFETGRRFGGQVDERLVADSMDRLCRLGVTLRRGAQVERLAVDAAGADLWIHGLPERFDLALVTTSSADERALLARSGLARHVGSAPLRTRVYFTEFGHPDARESARSALARMAEDHPGVRPCFRLPPDDSPLAHVVRSLARRAGGLTAAHLEHLDLSGELWPLDAPAVYVANQRWVLDATVGRHLGVRRLRTSSGTADELEAGTSLGFVVGDTAAALAALAVNAPIVPIAAQGRPSLARPHARARVVIGEPFYPETSSVAELMHDMRSVMRHLESLAVEHGSRARPAHSAPREHAA